MTLKNFPRKEKIKFTEKERRLLKNLPIESIESGLRHKDLSLDMLYEIDERNGDTLLDLLPQNLVKDPYNEIAERELDSLIKQVRNLLKIEIIERGKVARRLLKVYLDLFDTMMKGQKFSYSTLARKHKISRARLELIRDTLLTLPSMKRLIAILQSDASYRYS